MKRNQLSILKFVFILVLFFATLTGVNASTGDNVTGYAWSSNFGWISFNCTNDDSCFGGYDPDGAGGLEGPGGGPGPGDEDDGGAGGDGAINTLAPKANLAFFNTIKSFFSYVLDKDIVQKAYADDIPGDLGDLAGGISYGVSVDPATGNMSGYAWSTNLGWISFNGYGCPPEDDDGACAPHIDLDTGRLSGWAKVETAAGGSPWDGWISLSCRNHDWFLCGSYEVSYDPATGNLSDYAWGSIVGAIRFAGDTYAVHVDLDQPTVTLGASDAEFCPGDSITLEWNAVGDGLTCHAVSEPMDPLFNGVIANTGSVVLSPLAPTTYSISCTALGSDTAYQDTVVVGLGACGTSELVLSAEPAPAQCTADYETTISVYSPNSTTYAWCDPIVSIPAGATYPVVTAPNAGNAYVVAVSGVVVPTNPTTFQTTCYEPDATPLDMTDNPSMLVQTSVARACAAPRCDFTSASVGGEPLKASLTWTSSGGTGTGLTASGGWSGTKAFSGSQSGIAFTSPETTYTLTVTNPDGLTDTCTAVLNKSVIGDPICDPDPNDPNGEDCDVEATVDLNASPMTLGDLGGSTTLDWETTDVVPDSCVAYSFPLPGVDSWNGTKDDNGSDTVSITSSWTFKIACKDAYDPDGPMVEDTVFVEVENSPIDECTLDGVPPPKCPCTDPLVCPTVRTKPWYKER